VKSPFVGQVCNLRRIFNPPVEFWNALDLSSLHAPKSHSWVGSLSRSESREIRRRLQTCPTVFALLLLASCIKPTPLPLMGDAPTFQLTTQTGDTFDSKKLTGQIWVADFIYTTCPGPCPMMTRQMRQLQDQTAQEMHDVKLVSFTVDPVHDTPPVLAEYAKRYRMDPSRWWFLTGGLPALNDIGMGFKLNTIDGNLSHSTRFVLIDRHMKIRGYYQTDEDAFLSRLVHDIRQLERDNS
jgi:protein SCO1/2